MPTEKELDFNPDGPGQFTAAALDPLGAIFGFAADRAARKVQALRYPGDSAETSEANAFLHGAGSHLLTRILGPERAKAILDAHEVSGIEGLKVLGQHIFRKNTHGERIQDLYNNQVGRSLPPGNADMIEAAIRKGYFRNQPFKEKK